MIARNEYDLYVRDGRKEIVYLLQIPHQRLAVEEIAADKQAVCLEFPRAVYDRLKGIADGLGPFLSPGFIRVWGHAPVYVAGVYEFHRASPINIKACYRCNRP